MGNKIDLTGKAEQVEALFAQIKAETGQLDILVNNAATNPYFGPIINAPESAFDKTFEVNWEKDLRLCEPQTNHTGNSYIGHKIVRVAPF